MSHRFKIDDRVEGGKRGTDDHDTGRVVEIDGDRVRVAWDSQVIVWHERSELRWIRPGR